MFWSVLYFSATGTVAGDITAQNVYYIRQMTAIKERLYLGVNILEHAVPGCHSHYGRHYCRT
jgi:hypothetical protein